MPQIVQVILQTLKHLFHRIGVTVMQSCVRCNTWSYLVEINISSIILQNLVYIKLTLWTRTNKRHISAEYIVQLWQLVKMMRPYKLSDFGQTRIVLSTSVAQLRTHLLSIKTHRAELVDIERSAETTYALLFVDRRTAIFSSYENVTE